MNAQEQEIWDFLHRHLNSIFTRDVETYKATTGADLSLYEWFVTPHRQDGLDFHLFMIDHSWAGTGADFRYDLLEPRLQLYGEYGRCQLHLHAHHGRRKRHHPPHPQRKPRARQNARQGLAGCARTQVAGLAGAAWARWW